MTLDTRIQRVKLQLTPYGQGQITGAPAFGLSVDATGLVIETPIPAAAADFWRTDPANAQPDGVTDPADAIVRTGQTKIDTAIAGNSGLTLDDLRSRNSVQLTSGDAGVTDTNMSAIGVDLLGKVRLSNALSSPDLRGTNPAPQDYAAGVSYAFKQSATVGLTGVGFAAIPTYVELETTRRYANAADFSGGPVIQRVFIEDGRSYFRVSQNATTWGAWNLEAGSRSDLQTRFSSQANTKISAAGEVRWAGFYHIMTTGTNVAEPSGHFRIDMPADGFAVPVADGTTRAVVPAVVGSSIDTGGIPLNTWETLWYRHVYGTGSGFIPANLLIVPYLANTNANGPFTNSGDWIKIVSRDDAGVFSLGTGDVVGLCSQTGRGGKITADNWTAMKQRAMGDGYFYSPGGNTAVPLAFGFTGTIRWIDGGSTPSVNGAGFRDAAQAQKAVGTAIRGVNGAVNRAWRLMTAVEKPAWFGGALRGINPIVPATTTVVDLDHNETLYFVPNLESSGGNEGQWVIAGYSGLVSTPVHWLPIASRQAAGSNTTIQVLVGGVQYGLRAGDATYTTSPADHYKDAKHRAITHKGLKYCRWTEAAFFAGAAANGLTGVGAQGLLISWDDNTLMYGISDGYVSWGNQYSYINVPAIGFEIPVVLTGSNITRVVQNISGRKYIPLANWEALYFIPPAYTSGSSSVAGDFVIGNYVGNSAIPTNAILVAKAEGAVTWPTGTTQNKNRVRFADGTYIQPGVSQVTVLPPVQNDHAQGTGDWRPLVYPTQTGPGMNAAMPATAGNPTAYAAPYTAFYNYRQVTDDPRGNIHLEGIVALSGFVPNGGRVAFLPGVQVRGLPIHTVLVEASTLPGVKSIMAQIRFINETVNGSVGVSIIAYGMANTNPEFTLGVNGGASPAGLPTWFSLNNIVLPHI